MEDSEFLDKIDKFHKDQKKDKKKDKDKSKDNVNKVDDEDYYEEEVYDESSDEDKVKKPTEGITSEFKDMLRKYLDAESEIKEYNLQIKECKQDKTMLEEAIKEHMKRYGINTVNTREAKITLKTSKTVKPLKKEDYLSLLSDKVGIAKATELMDYIYEHRVYVETDKLSKTKRK